jgi:hypothetical protein
MYFYILMGKLKQCTNITAILKALFFIPKNSLIYPECVMVDKRQWRGYYN